MRAAQRYDLTPREGEILSYLARGRNAKYIADQLFVAERTVKTHTYHIYQKMDIHSQQELINIVEETE
nr:LuxR C-terminal-related transcriptional regulator [Adlercreutzia sp. JBNU-10]